jgi:hypothetical protein
LAEVSVNLIETSANTPEVVGGKAWTSGVGGGGYLIVAHPEMKRRLMAIIFVILFFIECLI